jgi:hypothetical protein
MNGLNRNRNRHREEVRFRMVKCGTKISDSGGIVIQSYGPVTLPHSSIGCCYSMRCVSYCTVRMCFVLDEFKQRNHNKKKTILYIH